VRAVTPPNPQNAARALDLARAGLSRPGAPAELPGRLLVVDVERQVATLIEAEAAVASWQVSTASRGIGGAEGSLRTPPGWHRISERIGHGADRGTVFVSRQATGETWRGEPRADDLILTRILTLDGVEDGINRGQGCDSLARYIYLHGTNQEELLGRAVSHGCVRLANSDIVELFDRLADGDYVLVAAPQSRTMPDPGGKGRFHYAGLAGAGMSALAQFQVMTGGTASGSDRAFDQGERQDFGLRRPRRLDGGRGAGPRLRRG
jgi:UDP-N-acetylmuramate--alanine ligase